MELKIVVTQVTDINMEIKIVVTQVTDINVQLYIVEQAMVQRASP